MKRVPSLLLSLSTQVQLDRRRPGQAGAGSISTGRNEEDAVTILSGIDRFALGNTFQILRTRLDKIDYSTRFLISWFRNRKGNHAWNANWSVCEKQGHAAARLRRNEPSA